MATDFTKLFVELGLPATETKVYVASLKLGPTSVQEISKEAGISRTACYDMIASLQERGLMTSFDRGKKRFFVAADPDRAASYFKGRMHDMEDRVAVFVKTLDELRLVTGGERPTVRFYEGREALFALFSDLELVKPKMFREVSNIDTVYEFLDPAILKEARGTLDLSKTDLKMLHRGPVRHPRPGGTYCQMPDDFEDFNGDIWLYGNRVAFVEFVGKMMTIIIESDVFSKMAIMLFDNAFATCSAHPDSVVREFKRE